MYSCSEVEDVLQVSDCGEEISLSSLDDIFLELDFVEKIYKEIIVTGETIEYECEYDEDCANELCQKCESGYKSCVHRLCQDCFSLFDCKEGYDCVDNVCVLENSLNY